MGMLAAHSMCGRIDDFGIDTKFELFSHVTRFFGYKVGYFFHYAVHVYFYSILFYTHFFRAELLLFVIFGVLYDTTM